MRLAWFSPLPPERSGIAAYSSDLLAQLDDRFQVDAYPERAAHDFVWRARRAPYDLVVYHLGNAACHDYMWAYLARFPGLVVLHDARLHHARARCLLRRGRVDDYRNEFRYDHPATNPAVTQYAIEGLGGSVYYLWSMVRVILDTARVVAVHSPWVAADLRETFPSACVETIRMGVPRLRPSQAARIAVRRQLQVPDDAIVFAAFGKITMEKRIPAILTTLAALVREGRPAYAMLVGDANGYDDLPAEIASHGLSDRVRVTGHVDDAAIADHLEAADVCLCLRWPTALETSASWLRCLAAGRPTIITDLAHLVDIPDSVVERIDPHDEVASLLNVLRELVADADRRDSLGRAGHAYWQSSHTLDAMVSDYARLLPLAASRTAPHPSSLPSHFRADYSQPATDVARRLGLSVDVLE